MRGVSQPSLRDVLRTGWRELLLYVAAGAAYVTIGVAAVEFLFSWVVAAVFLLLTVVGVPALVRRVRA